MRMRQLGRTGIEVSAYCLGTMVSGRNGDQDHDECARMVHRALDASHTPPSPTRPDLRRRPADERAGA
ncbi:hypothetical protein C5F59_020160 [Streptomyces sp. QL37]|uniref:hypothetical protein n=1 Tax=Streptomyces sp. QL37 TaxID=2093747 RepID=UPI0035BFA701